MTDGTVLHSSFTIQRVYRKSPALVFAAWSDPAAKARWFGGERHTLDFRVGGLEVVHGTDLRHEARYQDIVAGSRIVYTATLFTGDAPSTISLTTVQFAAHGTGTELLLTEQAAYLDGHEHPEWRERGTNDWLDALGDFLEGAPSWRSS